MKQHEQVNQERYAKESEVMQITSLSSNTLRAYEKKGTFPTRKRVGGRAIRWWLPDVLEWVKNPQEWKAA